MEPNKTQEEMEIIKGLLPLKKMLEKKSETPVSDFFSIVSTSTSANNDMYSFNLNEKSHEKNLEIVEAIADAKKSWATFLKMPKTQKKVMAFLVKKAEEDLASSKE
jgi:hypothetical protein